MALGQKGKISFNKFPLTTIRLQKRNRRATSPSARLTELAKPIHRPHIEKVDPVRKISEVKIKK